MAIPVLAYHGIHNSDNFERQLRFLKQNYSLISTAELAGFFKDKKELPKKPLLITSDDGDLSLYNKAFPVIEKLKVPFTIFLITDLINSEKPFWWNEIRYYLGQKAGDKKSWEVKEWPNRQREDYLKELREGSDKRPPKQRQLSSTEIAEMKKAGISFANHSHTHPMFDQCTAEELESELTQAKAILDNEGLESEVFAYPNGNYSGKTEKMLQKHGIELAFLFDHKLNKSVKTLNPFRISRLAVNDTTPLWKFKLILSGWHTKILPLTRSLGKLRATLKK
jgi:peptidoglycan/xylan/chitin deacetylase (PgdA/CDA1 family)